MRKAVFSVIVIFFVMLLLASCKTTEPVALKTPASQAKGPVAAQAQNMDQLPFRQLVEHYAQWRKQGLSIREALARLPHLGRIYTIDDYHTAVRVERNAVTGFVSDTTVKEFVALMVAYGGKPYTLVRDTLTGKMVPFRRVEIRDNKDLKGIHWVNLKTGKKHYDFLYKGRGMAKLRFEGGAMNIITVLTYQPSPRYDVYKLDTLILEHPDRQPFLYTTPNLPPFEQIPDRAPGGKLEDLPVFKKKTSFGSLLKGFFNANKEFIDEDRIEYVLAICNKEGGKARWVVSQVPEKQLHSKYFRRVQGTLTEVHPVDGWLYATTSKAYVPVWPEYFIGCEAVQPFVLKGVFQNIKGTDKWVCDQYLYPGRQITEMKFKPLPPSTRGFVAKEVQSQIARIQPGGETDPLARTIARNTASSRNPITQVVGAARYESSYNGTDSEGCALVSVTRFSDTTPKKRIPALETIFNYRVCGQEVKDLGITAPEAIREDVLDQLPEFSKTCQQYGETRMRTVNYELYCRPLRGESQCKVEISILKQGRMLKKFLYDGCTGRKIR